MKFILLAAWLASSASAADDFEGSVREVSGIAVDSLAVAETARASRPAPAADPRCAPESDSAPKLTSDEFHWGYALAELKGAYDKTYASPKRLPRRAYWNAATGRFEFPYLADRGGAVALPETFVRAVARHIEAAFERGAIDAVFFPDMGHSHFLIPEAHWKAAYDRVAVAEFSRLYEAMFRDPLLEVLYHTAEQLTTRQADGRLVDDERTRFRYATRNIVGTNSPASGLRVLTNPESRANTVNEVPGYFWWGGGFNISANENGCFAAQAGGRTIRFDLSLFDLEPSNPQ